MNGLESLCMTKPAAIKPVKPVILCGGSGTRLWPLSRKSFPKQFVPLINGKSLLQLTLERLALLGSEVTCVASDEHRFLVSECMQAANVKGTVLLEPVNKGEEQLLITENQSTYIPLGVKHRLENPGKTDLELIEVQSGCYLGEDDIVRFEDTYGR